MKCLLSFLTLATTATFAAESPSEVDMLNAAKQSPVVIEYLRQDYEGVDISQLTFLKSPGTLQRCTFMANQNNCSLSFRVIADDGRTLISGAVHYNGKKAKYSIFRIMDGVPSADSDFEDFSKAPKTP